MGSSELHIFKNGTAKSWRSYRSSRVYATVKRNHSVIRPPSALKSFANQMAERIMSTDGIEMARMLHLRSLLETRQETLLAKSSDLSHVGIWERKQENGQSMFVRSKDKMDEWRHWANVGRIGTKGSKLRVVFMGESVARGYLYDPLYTPSMALEQMLRHHLGEAAVEVIDLAR